MFWLVRTEVLSLPVDAGALNTQQHTQVDGGPAWVDLTAVTAPLIPWQTLYALQDCLRPDAVLPHLRGRVDDAGGRRRRSVQILNIKTSQTLSQIFICTRSDQGILRDKHNTVFIS